MYSEAKHLLFKFLGFIFVFKIRLMSVLVCNVHLCEVYQWAGLPDCLW